MVSVHTERLPKARFELWGPRQWHGPVREPDGSVTGRWWVEKQNLGSATKKGMTLFHNAEVCQIFWYVPRTMVQRLLGLFPFSRGTIDFLHDQVVRLPASRQKLSWGAMTCQCSCSAGVLPMDTGDKNPLRNPLQLCGLAGFSFLALTSKTWLQRSLVFVALSWTGLDPVSPCLWPFECALTNTLIGPVSSFVYLWLI